MNYFIIKEFEGLRLQAYRDSVGIPTIGYGTVRYLNNKSVAMGDTCTEAQAEEYLQYHIRNRILPRISDVLKRLNDNQKEAIISFCYNLGVGAFLDSTLRKKILANPNDPTIRSEFAKWVKAGGVVLNGLVKRRQSEADLYFKK
jgi:lysozyme